MGDERLDLFGGRVCHDLVVDSHVVEAVAHVGIDTHDSLEIHVSFDGRGDRLQGDASIGCDRGDTGGDTTSESRQHKLDRRRSLVPCREVLRMICRDGVPARLTYLLFAKAEEAMAAGDAGRAAELAAKAMAGADPGLRERAETLASAANLAQVDRLLERVVVAEEAELFEEAIDYVDAALDRAHDEGLRRQLKQRRADIEGRLEARRQEAQDEHPSTGLELQPEDAYDTLLGTLTESVAERYRGRSETFSNALLALSEGRSEEALEALDLLVELAPEDPVLRFERGHCRLLIGDGAEAADDLELAWEEFGDSPLNHRGDLSVPYLWGEAKILAGQNGDVADRLLELANPRLGNPHVTHVCARALVASERLDEAEDLLRAANGFFPKFQDFAHDLGSLLDRQGRPKEAIAHLEAAIAPTCTSGCGAPPMHPPSLRLLARLYLDQGEAPERAGELLGLARMAQGGMLTEEDHQLRQRYEASTQQSI